MNTGLRRGELLSLRWECVDFKQQLLTVEGGTAKSRQTRHVALNEEATRVLQCWRDQAESGKRVFEFKTSFKKQWAPLLKRAQITKFRWHDIHHHFASRLVQKGVPLNTVRTSWVAAQSRCRCDTRTWRPTRGARRSLSSTRSDSALTLRLQGKDESHSDRTLCPS